VYALANKCLTVVQVMVADEYSELEIVALDILDVSPVVSVFVVYRPPYYDAKDLSLLADCIVKIRIKMEVG